MAPATRPTGARLREALFSIWSERVVGARFLDLFAGSGAVGLEALSRGASRVVLVEQERRALEVLRRNVAAVAANREVSVMPLRVDRALHRIGATGERFDLLFADPPYHRPLAASFATRMVAVSTPEAEWVLELASEAPTPELGEAWIEIERRTYGDSAIVRFARAAGGTTA